MMKPKSIRLLIAWVLAAALVTAFGSDAFASSKRSFLNRPSVGATALKPFLGPRIGEPDVPTGLPKPVVTPQSGAPLSTWVLRVQWTIRVVLMRVP